MSEELLKIEDLSVEYRVGITVAKAVNHLNLTIHKGEALGLVGESGAGKTTTALSVLKLLPDNVSFVTGGRVTYNGQTILDRRKDEDLAPGEKRGTELSEEAMTELRGAKISMVFQNPLTSLNPVFTAGHQIAMGLMRHQNMSKAEADKEAAKLLRMVGIAEYRLNDYPHQFSGGMRQRVGIAAALACNPELLICDEPTTALDVTIQAQILELMKELQTKMSSSLLMITHNLGIISELCENVAVMYGGNIVEYGTVKEVFTDPRHWYTIGLLNAIPKLTGPRERLNSIPGNVANAQNLPDGCVFHPRCDHCSEQCKAEAPVLTKVNDNHFVACWNRK